MFDDFEEESLAARVIQTGIALVHEGEVVLPAAGSEAQAQRVMDDDRSVVHYHFPVEIEVRSVHASAHTDGRIDDALRAVAALMERH